MTMMSETGKSPGNQQPGVHFRRGTLADTRAINEVAERSLDDLVQRSGWKDGASPIDEAGLERELQTQLTLYEHLARTADQFWVAERDGEMVGVARSILRGGLRELTELFVLPEAQSAGIGTELLKRAFPADDASLRCLLATSDLPALAQYMKAGVFIRFPNYSFVGPPEATSVPTDLAFERVAVSADVLEEIARIDENVLGHRRDVDHRWLLADRPGLLYRRNGQVVGYGYVGKGTGPFALLDPADFPAVLAHAESIAAGEGQSSLTLVVPMINSSAVSYLLGRGFRLDPFFSYVMSDRPFGRFEQYIETTPTFFL